MLKLVAILSIELTEPITCGLSPSPSTFCYCKESLSVSELLLYKGRDTHTHPHTHIGPAQSFTRLRVCSSFRVTSRFLAARTLSLYHLQKREGSQTRAPMVSCRRTAPTYWSRVCVPDAVRQAPEQSGTRHPPEYFIRPKNHSCVKSVCHINTNYTRPLLRTPLI